MSALDANQQRFQDRIKRIESGEQFVPDGVIVTQRGKAVIAGKKPGKGKQVRARRGKGPLMVMVLVLGLGLGAVAFSDDPVLMVMMATDWSVTTLSAQFK